MKSLLIQIFSFILPITVLIIVTLNIEPKISIPYFSTLLDGLLMILSGLFLIILTISKFITIGKGTLAPWSPTKKLIIEGIYRYVRNPMIIGVLFVLTGESIATLSQNIFTWAVIFFIINNIYFFLLEEPLLVRKFGDDYREYKKNVPRWIPLFKPYIPTSEK